MATTNKAHNSGFAKMGAELTQSAVVLLVGDYGYIWADTTRNAVTVASSNPVAVSQKQEVIIR